MSVLTFLCLHIFKQQKQQKDLGWWWGGGGVSDRRAITTTDMSRPIQAFPFLSLFQFSLQESCSGVGLAHCMFDEDIFEQLTLGLSLTRHLSQTRGISLVGDDDDDSNVILKVLMKLTRGGVRRSMCSPSQSGASLSLREQCVHNHLGALTNNKRDLLV